MIGERDHFPTREDQVDRNELIDAPTIQATRTYETTAKDASEVTEAIARRIGEADIIRVSDLHH